MNTPSEIFNRLVNVARAYSSELSKRNGVESVFLYGSAAYGTVSSFSDVDIALVYSEPFPQCWVEHRIVEGVKVDIVSVPLYAVKELTAQHYDMPWFVLKGILLGGPHSVLYDPNGHIAAAKQALLDVDWERDIAVPWCLRWLRSEVIKTAAKAKEADPSQAVALLRRVIFDLDHMFYVLYTEKQPSVTAEKLGVAGYADLAASIVSTVAPRPEHVSALIEAYRELWNYTLAHAYAPIRQRLLQAGVQEPEKLELIGDYGLYWPGHRLHELGRVLAEVDLALNWGAFELERQAPLSAWILLWGVHPQSAERRWRAISAALNDIGLDVADVVEGLLADTAFKQLSARSDTAYKRAQDLIVSEPQVRTAARQAEELCSRMEAALVSRAPGAA
jgi:predicted nucleotidyltransferase